MRILIPASKDFLEDKNANPFISLLYNGLRERGYEMYCGLKDFWNQGETFDIVFFQWPEAVFGKEKIDNKRFRLQLERLKHNGVKMLATCHNLHAHSNDSDANLLYDDLYGMVDVFHHLGHYSEQLFLGKYPNSKHFVAQHPIFFDIADMGLDPRKCRKKLGLPLNRKIILSFGKFRNDDEKQLFYSLRNCFSPSAVALVAPGLDHGYGLCQGWHLEKSFINLCKRITLRMNQIYCRRGIIDKEDVPDYFMAADIIFIQRLQILNSGNVPLAFAAAKPVVGPDMGNVGELLKATGNPAFDVNSQDDIFNKCRQALKLAESNETGKANYRYARQQMMPELFLDTIASQIDQMAH